MFTLADLLAGSGGHLAAGRDEGSFRGVAIDSRTASVGDLFVAFRGQKHDGHAFVTQAFARGAAGALVESLPAGEPWASVHWEGPPVVLVPSSGQALQDLASYWRRRHDLAVVGVTGSIGKTTTKELIASLLEQRFPTLRTPANLNTDIGVPLTLLKLDSGHRAAVLEMAMYDMGEIRRLAQIAAPTIGVVTQVSHSHLERLGSLERIAEAKSELVQELPSTGLAVLNADDERVRRMASLSAARVLFYGVSPEATVRGGAIESHGLRGIEFTVHFQEEQLRAKLGLLGTHSVHAALAAVAVALHLGMSLEEAVGGLKRAEQGLRLAVAEGINGSTLLDDTYNANPTSMLAALNLLGEMEGRRVAVLGDMLELGSFEFEGHCLVGRRAASVVDWLITVGRLGRWIAQEARTMGMSPEAVESFDGNDEAIRRLQMGLRPGDFVLLKGSRGMRLDEVVAAVRTAG